MYKHATLLRLSAPALLLAGLAISTVTFATATAQSPQSPQSPPNNPDAQIMTTQSAPTPDDTPGAIKHNPKSTPAKKADDSWSMLTIAVKDPKHAELRIQALAALGTLGSNPRSIQLISAAMSDPDLDVRTAAALAAGQTASRNLTSDLRTMLDDKEPQVAFTAAVTLAKMNDRSGEDILIAVIDGERSANATMMNGTMHSFSKTLRSPTALAKFGALQGASFLLGPFGYGLTALEYMHKNSSTLGSTRVIAIEQLSQQKSGPIRTVLVAALTDKDPAVRAAAAKALGGNHDTATADSLYPLLDDPKAPVRLTAAAAYINTTSPIRTHRPRNTRLQ